jgi:hypothetical protein
MRTSATLSAFLILLPQPDGGLSCIYRQGRKGWGFSAMHICHPLTRCHLLGLNFTPEKENQSIKKPNTKTA